MSRGISKFQWEITRYVAENGEGGMEMHEVLLGLSSRSCRSFIGYTIESTPKARRTVKPSFQVTFYRAVSSLEKRGIVTRVKENSDRPTMGKIFLYLTERGKAMLEWAELEHFLQQKQS